MRDRTTGTWAAWVRCDCFETGRTRPPPLPPALLSFGPDGLLRIAPGTPVSEVHLDALMAWRQDGCEHPGMAFAAAELADSARYFLFFQVGRQLGWPGLPALRAALPDRDQAWVDPGLARAALDDVARFRDRLDAGMPAGALVVEETGAVVMEVAGTGRSVLLSGLATGVSIELEVGGVTLRRGKDDAVLFQSPAFLQDVTVTDGAFREAEFLCLETEASFRAPAAFGDGDLQRRGPVAVPRFAECLRVEVRALDGRAFDDVLDPLARVLGAASDLGRPLIWRR